MNFKMVMSMVGIASALSLSIALNGCGGGGAGGSSSRIIYYPYETVYGDTCQGYEPTPGCTFLTSNGERAKVTEDPDYDRYRHGTGDMWTVEFDGMGYGDVYDENGYYRYTKHVSEFSGYVGGTQIGVGTTGFFWENVSYNQYWIGKNGVLYSANYWDSNYGEAINSDSADDMADTNFAALTSEANKELVALASEKLVKEYGFKTDKAQAVASALNTWAVAAQERGFTTTKDMDKTFKSVFGVDYRSALSAVQDLKDGQKESMKDLTNRSAAALGLKPHQAQKFIKNMYRNALASWGYNIDDFSW